MRNKRACATALGKSMAGVSRRIALVRTLLHLRVDAAAKAAAPDEDVTAVKDLEAVAAGSGRARRGLRDGAYVRLREERRPKFAAAWREARLAFEAIVGLITGETAHASS